METPPESKYTQAEIYEPMEAAIAASIEALPDFPGFGGRSWREMPCSHNGVDDPNYTSIEISYSFPAEVEESDLVRKQYVDVLRDHWTSLGYTITGDSAGETNQGRLDHDLTAEVGDGISVWYQVWGKVLLNANSGCVPISDKSEIPYLPPLGGVEPGHDAAVDDYFPDGIPTDQAAAIDPFATSRAAFGPVPFDSPESYDGLI